MGARTDKESAVMHMAKRAAAADNIYMTQKSDKMYYYNIRSVFYRMIGGEI